MLCRIKTAVQLLKKLKIYDYCIEWGVQVLLPDMAKSSCKRCIFILNEIPTIEDEIDLWSAEFKKYFQAYKVQSYQEAVKVIMVAESC